MIKMKKFFSGLTIVLLVSSLFIVSFVYFGEAQSSATTVNGAISTDTIWTKANSPYSLIGNVFVNNGVTLTIEHGATVYLNDYALRVNGTLNARGTANDRINMVSDVPTMWSAEGIIVFLSGSTSWNEQTQTGCILENVNLNATQPLPSIYLIDAAPKINLCYIANTSPTFNANAGAITIQRDANITTVSSPIISNNVIARMLYGISSTNSQNPAHAYISGNYIFDCSTAINTDGNDTITNNLLYNNGAALNLQMGSPQTVIIQNNTIYENEFGFQIMIFPPFFYNIPRTTNITNGFCFNNLENNIYNEIDIESNDVINASYNWWGTSDAQTINQTVFSALTYYNPAANLTQLGALYYQPYLSSRNPAAPTVDYAPLPQSIVNPTQTSTPTPSSLASTTPVPTIASNPTNSPTSRSIESPTSSPTASVSPSAIPTAPEFSIMAFAIATLVASTVIATVLIKKRKK